MRIEYKSRSGKLFYLHIGKTRKGNDKQQSMKVNSNLEKVISTEIHILDYLDQKLKDWLKKNLEKIYLIRKRL